VIKRRSPWLGTSAMLPALHARNLIQGYTERKQRNQKEKGQLMLKKMRKKILKHPKRMM